MAVEMPVSPDGKIGYFRVRAATGDPPQVYDFYFQQIGKEDRRGVWAGFVWAVTFGYHTLKTSVYSMLVTEVDPTTLSHGQSCVNEERKVILHTTIQMRDINNAFPSGKYWSQTKRRFGEERDVWDIHALLLGHDMWDPDHLKKFIENLNKHDVSQFAAAASAQSTGAMVETSTGAGMQPAMMMSPRVHCHLNFRFFHFEFDIIILVTTRNFYL